MKFLTKNEISNEPFSSSPPNLQRFTLKMNPRVYYIFVTFALFSRSKTNFQMLNVPWGRAVTNIGRTSDPTSLHIDLFYIVISLSLEARNLARFRVTSHTWGKL